MSNALTLVFYLAVFALSTFFFYLYTEKGKSKIYLIISFILPVLLAALRLGVGKDYYTYVDMYNEFHGISLVAFLNGYIVEPSFYFITQLSELLTDSHTGVFIVYAIITVVASSVAILQLPFKYRYIYFAIFLLVIFPLSFNIMRQIAAASLVLLASVNFSKKQYISSLIYMLIACLIHYSAIVVVPILFCAFIILRLKDKNLLKKNIIITTSAAVILTMLIIPLLLYGFVKMDFVPYKYIDYFQFKEIGFNSTFFLMIILLVGSLSIARKRISEMSRIEIVFLILSVFAVIFLSIGFYSDIGRRLYVLLLLPTLYLCTHLFIDRVNAKSSVILVLCLAILYNVIFYGVLENGQVLPYRSVLL